MAESKYGAPIEIGLARHAPKKDTPKNSGGEYEVADQQVDVEAAEGGIEQFTRELIERLDVAPAGTIMALEPSNIERAKETRNLIKDKLTELLADRDDIEMVEIGQERRAAETLVERINAEPDKKFVITDIRDTELIGFNKEETQVKVLNKWKTIFAGNEDLIGKLRAAHPGEIAELQEEIAAAGIDLKGNELHPQEFGTTPEEVAMRLYRWMQIMKRIGEKHFPNRPLILEGISHNIRADFTMLALLDEDISLESINRVLGGKFREPLERSSVSFAADGHVEVAYRKERKLYSPEEFSNLLARIKKNARTRKEEWQDMRETTL